MIVIANHMHLLEGPKERILVLHPLDMELLFPINLLYVQLLVGC